jgi:hypothetical protein
MTPAERLAEARGMAILAAELQDRGILTAAGEMLWGAINHIIKAIVEHHGLVMSNGNPMLRRPAMEHLQRVDPRNPPLEDSLTVVGQLHGHFYNKHMSEAQHEAAMTASFELVVYLLNRPEVQAIP